MPRENLFTRSWWVALALGLWGIFISRNPGETGDERSLLEVGHETSDASARGVLWVAIALVLGAAALEMGFQGAFRAWRAFAQAPSDGSLEAGWMAQRRELRGPRLQPDPVAELRDYQRREREKLESDGSAGAPGTDPRISIEHAMDRLAQPARPEKGGRP